MKVHTDLKELLEDFTIKIMNRWMNGDKRDYSEFVNNYTSSNSLALGKQEPLTKNKQHEEFCKCKEGPTGRSVTADFEHQICDTCGLIAK